MDYCWQIKLEWIKLCDTEEYTMSHRSNEGHKMYETEINRSEVY